MNEMYLFRLKVFFIIKEVEKNTIHHVEQKEFSDSN